MHRFFGLVLVSGLVLGSAGDAKAQFSLTIGNPYTATGLAFGSPYYGGYNVYSGYGYPYGSGTYSSYYAAPGVGAYLAPSYGVTTYSSGYVVPGTTTFYSSNYGFYPRAGYYGYGYRPSSVWMGVPRASSVWMGGGWRRGWGGRFYRW